MTAPSFDVSGKRVLVTGGRGGLGLAIGEAFKGAGARVTLVDMAPPPAAKDGFEHVLVDVTDTAAVQKLADATPSLDVLVQCAGKLARVKEYEVETFQHIVDVHLFGSFRFATSFRPKLAASRGCIINVGSMFSLFGSSYAPAYAASKGGMVQMTRAFACAWAKDNIQVNAVLPGWIDTDLTRRARQQVKGLHERVLGRTPAGRWGTPDDHAGIAVFLGGPGSDFVTGTAIPVDGGYSVQG